eukprot:46475-Chlamydomonas_euryale.AAC.1
MPAHLDGRCAVCLRPNFQPPAQPANQMAAHLAVFESRVRPTRLPTNRRRWGLLQVDETPKGWFITLIQKDPMEEIQEEKRLKRAAAEKEEEERHLQAIHEQVWMCVGSRPYVRAPPSVLGTPGPVTPGAVCRPAPPTDARKRAAQPAHSTPLPRQPVRPTPPPRSVPHTNERETLHTVDVSPTHPAHPVLGRRRRTRPTHADLSPTDDKKRAVPHRVARLE